MLALVNDLVMQAEAKLGVILATTGVSGGILFSLVKGWGETGVAFDAVAVVCAASVFVAGACAMIGLYPRVTLRRKMTDAVANPLFFHDVACIYKNDPSGYGAMLHTLTTDPGELVRHLSQQIHANATIAQRKYRWANRAIRALLLDLLAIASLATIIALRK